MLGAAALTLNGATGLLQLHFRKLPLPLRVPALNDPAKGFPMQLGPWVQISRDQPIDPEVEQQLGTRQYIFRDYVDSRQWPGEDLAGIRLLPEVPRAEALQRYQTQKPLSVIRAAITYYTGLADTVAHIPERCYVADGFEPSAFETTTHAFGNLPQGAPRTASYRTISFEDQTGRARVARVVGYLFRVNGQYESDSLAVRRRLQNLFERYGYFSKLEMMTTSPGIAPAQHDQMVEIYNQFLEYALPEWERCLPDWEQSRRPKAGAK